MQDLDWEFGQHNLNGWEKENIICFATQVLFCFVFQKKKIEISVESA